MIRIDEIYSNTFWPWLNQNCPGTRMFFCDPPGQTDPDALFNLGRDDIQETSYVFFHDQEPIWMDLHQPLFEEVIIRNYDIVDRDQPGRPLNFPTTELTENYIKYVRTYQKDYDKFLKQNQHAFSSVLDLNRNLFNHGHVIVSEHGENVNALTNKYGWKSHYYFYHGWACLDWFRGYDRSFLIPQARDRNPTKTFMSPNRIVAGKRDHRVLFLYNVFKHGLDHNWISAPRDCVYENVDILTVASKYNNIYPDIEQVFAQSGLPKLFPGEETQQMASCWLSNFDVAADSLFYVPTETLFFGKRLHITEKTFKAIALEMPFILMAPAGSLEYMRSYGFKTFASVLDESYDQESDDIRRVEMVIKQLKEIDSLPLRERLEIHRACLPAVEHNYNHFYRGGFGDILWQELVGMLRGLSV
jgi:hypothetical protein